VSQDFAPAAIEDRRPARDVMNMESVRQFLVRSTIVLHVVAVMGPDTAAAAGQVQAPDPRVPTSIELALAEHSCGPQTPTRTDAAHFECLSAAVGALRAHFGYNLGRLSAAQRNAIDRSCGPRRTAEGRDAYVGCVSRELASLGPGETAPTAVTATTTARGPVAAPAPVAASVESTPRTASSSTWVIWLIGLLAVCGGVGAGIAVARRGKPAQHACRNCGTTVPSTADLCPDCRRHAAEAIRHAAAERAERERILHEETAPKLEHVKEPPRAPEAAAGWFQHEPEQHDQQARVEDRAEEEVRLPEEQAQSCSVERQPENDPAVTGDDVFDPYAILGLSPGATRDAVVEACARARAKYDPIAVEFLGDEVRHHYEAKAGAIERAYRMLSSDVAAPPLTSSQSQ
jgi:hypothetical protein